MDQPNTPAVMSSDTVQHVTDVFEPAPTFTEPTTGALQRLEAEAAAMETAFKIAKGLCQTPMVPEHFQGEHNAHSLAAAILYGAELGLSASASAQNVFVVKGKPAVYARTMAAQVRRAGYRIEEVEASDSRVVWRAERDGHWATSEWTIERAEQAGYTGNRKYQSNPQEMLRAKCIAEVCRIQYQDVLLGMAYSVEELQLDNVTVQRVVKREPRGAAALRDIAAQKKAIETPPEPAKDGDTPGPAPHISEPQQQPEPEADPDDGPATTEQVDKIRRLFKARGVTGAQVMDETVMLLCLEERPASLNKLTVASAEVLLDLLQEPSG